MPVIGWEQAMRVDGRKLRQARERKLLTIREFADAAGLGFVTVWRLENAATRAVRMSTVRKLAQALDVPADELVDWDAGAGEPEEGKAAA